MSGNFWEGETYAIVSAMKRAGNRPGIIQQWKENVARWAEAGAGPDVEAVKAWLPHWQARPFYTAEELAPLWPALAIAIGYTNDWPAVVKSPRRLEFELDYADLPRLDREYRQHFIVERIHHWSHATPLEIEREFDAHRR